MRISKLHKALQRVSLWRKQIHTINTNLNRQQGITIKNIQILGLGMQKKLQNILN